PAVYRFRYPDGAHNAEALVVDPAGGRIYVVTKASSQQAVYRSRLPLRPGAESTLERVRAPIEARLARLSPITGAALSPDGTRLVVRTYVDALEWRRKRGASFEALFRARPMPVALALELQGESIAYTRNGRSLVTTSEQLPAPLWELDGR